MSENLDSASQAGRTAVRDESGHSSPDNLKQTLPINESKDSLLKCLLGTVWKRPPVATERPPAGQKDSNVLSRIFCTWQLHLIYASWTRSLEINDFQEQNPQLNVEVKLQTFKQHFTELYTRKARQPLVRAIIATFPYQTALSALLITIYIQTMLWSSMLFRYFGQYLEAAYYDENPKSFSFGLGIALAFAAVFYIALLMRTHGVYKSTLLGGQVRTLLAALLYEKCFRIAPAAVRPGHDTSKSEKSNVDEDPPLYWEPTTVFNTMTVDTERIEAAVDAILQIIPFVTWPPVLIGISYWVMRWPGVVGTASLFTALPVIVWTTLKILKRIEAINQASRHRARLTQAILTAVRHVKMFCWEKPLLDNLDEARKKEAGLLKRIQRLKVANGVFMITMMRAPTMVATGLYSAFFNISDSPDIMVLHFMMACSMDWLLTAMKRMDDINLALPSTRIIEDYLGAEEQDSSRTQLKVDPTGEFAVDMKSAEYSWHAVAAQTPQLFKLSNLNLQVRRGELLAVVGAVGSGKSSLGLALAGQMVHLGGDVTLGMSQNQIAYCAQKPWIQNANVRDNIIFGLPFDEDKYDTVKRAAAIQLDIDEVFPNGDDTELGEKGITISGGQKARLQLARILYRSQCDMVILDDPLSAVDGHTSKSIMRRAILEHLADRTRILITNQLQYISQCDRVAWVKDGCIQAVGHYEELMASEPEFKAFVAGTKQQDGFSSDDGEVELDAEEARARRLKEKEFLVKDERDRVAKLFANEEYAIEPIAWSLHRTYLRFGSSWVLMAFLVASLLVSQAVVSLYSQVISWWTSDYFHLESWKYPMIALGLIVLQAFTWGGYYVGWTENYVDASYQMSKQAFSRILHRPMAFFDTTPMGRMSNLLISDINRTNTELPFDAWQMSLASVFLVSLVIPIIVYVPLSAALFVPWCLSIFILVEIYRWSPLRIERILVPLKNDFSKELDQAIDGRTTLVTCGRQDDFQRQLHTTMDDMNSVHFMTFGVSAWISHAVSVTNGLFTWLVGILVLRQRESLAPALGLLMLILAPDICNIAQMLLEATCRFQRGMNSVERLNKYRISSDDEGPLRIPDAVSASWPSHGEIKISDVSMRYRPDTPLVLHGLSLNVLPGEKVGIVGRTGAGKSSLLHVLQRMMNIENGTIFIDGIDISQIGVHDLRSKMSVIPQDPISFDKDIRFDLDPYADPNDRETTLRLENALRAVCLMQDDHEADINEKTSHPDKQQTRLTLESKSSEVSAGGQQLIALARALYQDSKIVLIDEATSNVDLRTDAQIQQTLRVQFKDRTVLTIAHRIRTVINYDKICVMKAGRVVQFGTPSELWKDEAGIFREMCNVQGISLA